MCRARAGFARAGLGAARYRPRRLVACCRSDVVSQRTPLVGSVDEREPGSAHRGEVPPPSSGPATSTGPATWLHGTDVLGSDPDAPLVSLAGGAPPETCFDGVPACDPRREPRELDDDFDEVVAAAGELALLELALLDPDVSVVVTDAFEVDVCAAAVDAGPALAVCPDVTETFGEPPVDDVRDVAVTMEVCEPCETATVGDEPIRLRVFRLVEVLAAGDGVEEGAEDGVEDEVAGPITGAAGGGVAVGEVPLDGGEVLGAATTEVDDGGDVETISVGPAFLGAVVLPGTAGFEPACFDPEKEVGAPACERTRPALRFALEVEVEIGVAAFPLEPAATVAGVPAGPEGRVPARDRDGGADSWARTAEAEPSGQRLIADWLTFAGRTACCQKWVARTSSPARATA